MEERGNMCRLEDIARLINQNDDFLLISHISPDGDTFGCMLGLGAALKKLGKRVQTVCENPVPKIYGFLPGANQIITPENAIEAHCAIALDCADKARLGSAKALFEGAKVNACVDHHGTNPLYAQYNYVEESAAAAEIVTRLIELLPVDFDEEISTCLYCGIVTDTGNFGYSNTTPKSLTTAAKLLAHGAKSVEINRRVYRTAPVSKRRLLGLALIKAEFDCGGKIAFCKLSKGDYADLGAKDEDTEGIIDHLRDIENVEIAILLREAQNGDIKVSMRSKEYADVANIAAQNGGGGHVRAAGFTAKGDMDTICRKLIETARKAI